MVTPRPVPLMAFLLAFSVLRVSVASSEPVSNMEDLGYLAAAGSSADTHSVGVAINDAGQVAGSSTDGNNHLRAVLFDHGVVTNLDVLEGGYESESVDINASGQVVGTLDAPGGRRAFLYSNGTMTNLGVLPGGDSSEAVAINDEGQVIGFSSTSSSYAHAFLWQDGVMTDLGTLPGGDTAYPTAINGTGQVTGYADTATERHAFLYSGETMIDLGTLGGSASYGFALNEAGDVVGGSRVTGDLEEHAFLHHAGVMTDLGTLGGSYAAASAINEAGDVAGSASIADDSEYHPFLHKNGTMFDLGTPGALQDTAVRINANGDVLGYTIDAGTFHVHSWVHVGGQKRDIGHLVTGGGGTFASDWNSLGVITGSSYSERFDAHAFVTSCGFEPMAACDSGAKGSLSVRNDADDDRDALRWKWARGSAITMADFGDPVAAHGYRLCVYDATTGTSELAAALAVRPGVGWSSTGTTGWRYRDGHGDEDGVAKIQLKAGGSGVGKIQLVAKGAALPTPDPHSAVEYFDADPQITVQLVRDGGPQCWSSEFTDASTNSGQEYQATRR